MVLDIKSIFIDAFIKLFENVIWVVPIALIIAIYLFFFRNEVAYDWELTRREKNKLTEKSFLGIVILISATIAYLYIKEYYFLLVIVLSFILTYFLYSVGIIDMIAEKIEGKYGR